MFTRLIFTEDPIFGSTIKYDYSDSVISYYTTWYAVHSVTTSYLCSNFLSPLSLHHVTLNLVSCFYFLLKLMLATISTSVSDGIQSVIMLYTG